MRVLRDDREAVRKLLRIWIPVSDATKPAGIDVKHLHSEFGRIADHAPCGFFRDVHATAPTVVDSHRIIGILPGFGIVEHLAYPTAQHVAGAIRPVAKSTQKHYWCFEGPTGR